MLVKLYDHVDGKFEYSLPEGIKIVRAMALDKERIVQYVKGHFSDICPEWAYEAEASIFKTPVSCFIALEGTKIVGFACYNTSALGFFGPFGVTETYRKKGIGAALLKESLLAMKYEGYAYAIIGWVSSEEYYANAIGAITIEGSFPGVYSRLARIDEICNEVN